MNQRIAWACFAGLLFVVGSIAAASAAEIPKVKIETIVKGLDNPTAVAIRPGTNELFISESGAGQVVRVMADKPARPTPIVRGFPVAAAPAPLGFRVGPLGIAFLDRVTFAVGCGGLGEGKDVVGIYTLPAAGKTRAFGEARQTLGPISAGPESKSGEGFFYGLAATPNAIFVTSRGDDAAGWISRAFVLDSGGKATDIRPLIKTKPLTHVGGPLGIAVSKRGELVVGECGDFDKPHATVLSFYNPKNGKLLMSVPTGLDNIVGLAYSPRTGSLYGVDLGSGNGKQAGIYRLDAERQDGKTIAKAVKIAALDRPTALAFAPDGTLYATLLGTAKKKDAPEKMGRLVRISGDL